MENFEFVSPTHFVFGRGAEEKVGAKLASAAQSGCCCISAAPARSKAGSSTA